LLNCSTVVWLDLDTGGVSVVLLNNIEHAHAQ